MRKTIFATGLAMLAVLSLSACNKKMDQAAPAEAVAPPAAVAAVETAPVQATPPSAMPAKAPPRRGDPTRQ